MAVPAVVAVCIGYAKFSAVENKVLDHSNSIAKIEARTDSNKESISLTVQKQSTLELQQTLVSGEFRDSLKRIEDDVKELKQDLKTSRVKP